MLFLFFYKWLLVSEEVKCCSYPSINGCGYMRELNAVPILCKWLWVSEGVKCYSYPSINDYGYPRELNAIPILLLMSIGI